MRNFRNKPVEMSNNTPFAVEPRRTEGGGTFVTCPFVYGSIAYYMGKKADSYASHKWSLFIRGPNFEDMSSFVSRVVFTLHPSFAIPIREIMEPPYQVSEYGWGEFEAGIRIFFRDPNEQPIDLIHQIRLYPPASDPTITIAVEPQNPKIPVVAELYDEVVFTSPTETFKRLLMMYSVSQTDISALVDGAVGMEQHYTKYCDDADLQQLANVQDIINREMDQAKTRLLQVEADLNAMLSDPLCVLKPPADVPESGGTVGVPGASSGSSSSSSSSSTTTAIAITTAATTAIAAAASVSNTKAFGVGDTKGTGAKAAAGAPKAAKAPGKSGVKRGTKAPTASAMEVANNS